jgi:hypothetical protein
VIIVVIERERERERERMRGNVEKLRISSTYLGLKSLNKMTPSIIYKPCQHITDGDNDENLKIISVSMSHLKNS